MFRSNFDHPQADIFFFLLSLVTEVKKQKYLPEDGQSLTETCRRILRILKQYDYFNVLF